MITFLQYNYIALIAIVALILGYVYAMYLCKKHEVPEAKIIVRVVCGIAMCINLFAIVHTTFLNQLPKTVIDKSYVEQSANKYQESVIRNTNKGK